MLTGKSVSLRRPTLSCYGPRNLELRRALGATSIFTKDKQLDTACEAARNNSGLLETSIASIKTPASCETRSQAFIGRPREGFEAIHRRKTHRTARSSNSRYGVGGKIYKAFSRLQTFEQLDLESDFQEKCSHRTRLVDDERMSKQAWLWEKLFRFRSRVYGLKGVSTIWRGFRSIPRHRAPRILDSEILVKGFIEAGFQDRALLYDFCKYVSYSREIQSPASKSEDLYFTILLHVLRCQPQEAEAYHEMLKHYPPSKAQTIELIRRLSDSSRTSGDERALGIFRNLCFGLENFRDMYDRVMPGLCTDVSMEEAMEWHRTFFEHNDLPTNPSSTEPIIAHLARLGEQDEIDTILYRFKTKRSLAKNSLVSLTEEKGIDYCATGRTLEGKYQLNIATPTEYSDEFCAKILATRFLSVKNAVRSLDALGVKEIGPLAMREILLRNVSTSTCDLRALGISFELLKEAGITSVDTAYSRLVHQLVAKADSALLFNIATCDLHPDEFGNRLLQERLLAQYELQKDWAQYDRTAAILLVNFKGRRRKTYLANVALRNALERGDEDLFKERLRMMQEKNIPVTRFSRSTILSRLLPKRAGYDEKELNSWEHNNLNFCLTIMQQIMLDNNTVVAQEWRTILNSLLLCRRVGTYEDTWNFLLDQNRKLTSGNRPASEINGYDGECENTAACFSWQDLLDTKTIGRIVKTGFHHASLAKHQTSIERSGESVPQDFSLANQPSFWGVKLLVKLRDHGLPVDRKYVKRACLGVLWIMLLPSLWTKPGNRSIGLSCSSPAVQYVAAFEEIWGADLFQRTGPLDDYVAQLSYSAIRHRYLNCKRILRTMDKHDWDHFGPRHNGALRNVSFRRCHLLEEVKRYEKAGFTLDPDPRFYISPRVLLELNDTTPSNANI